MELTAHLSFGTVLLMIRQLEDKTNPSDKSLSSIVATAVTPKPQVVKRRRQRARVSTSLRGNEEKEQWFGHDTGKAGHTVSLCF